MDYSKQSIQENHTQSGSKFDILKYVHRINNSLQEKTHFTLLFKEKAKQSGAGETQPLIQAPLVRSF